MTKIVSQRLREHVDSERGGHMFSSIINFHAWEAVMDRLCHNEHSSMLTSDECRMFCLFVAEDLESEND